MLFWQWTWTILWFGGLILFSVLSLVITVKGGKDLRSLLLGLQRRAEIEKDDTEQGAHP